MANAGKPGTRKIRGLWIAVAAGIVVLGILAFVLLGTGSKKVEYFTTKIERGPVKNVVSATGVWAVWDGSGNLTITVDTDPGADANVAWLVDGRSASDLS